MDINELLEDLRKIEKTAPPISYDDLKMVMLVFARQHEKDYPNTLVACAYHLICEATRYSYEKSLRVVKA